jgi:GNAT superfamily N-acetyltransferase
VRCANCLFRMTADRRLIEAKHAYTERSIRADQRVSQRRVHHQYQSYLIDLDVVHRFLTECYWAKGIPRDVVARSIENSLCFGVFAERKQVGFARVISDYAIYAYVGDVFVLESFRGHGLGKWFMECVLKYPRLQRLRRWSLVTRDAHGLYSKLGVRASDEASELHGASLPGRL